MQYLGYIFGIFGLMAYLQLSSLKGRVAKLEEQLTRLKGTSFHDDRKALVQVAKSYIGQKVTLELKEDQQDIDIVMYGTASTGPTRSSTSTTTGWRCTLKRPRAARIC